MRIYQEILSHPPYSPVLAPPDFLLFGPLKDAILEKRYENYEHIMRKVRMLLRGRAAD